jgi:hypothetical protein
VIGALIRRTRDVAVDSFRIWWLAPVIPLIAVLPEFAQHVAEVQLGMFDSIEQARAVANGPTRWAFGYAKIAGLVVAILAAVRFWAARRQGVTWWSPKGIAWRVLALGIGANVAISVLGSLLESAVATLPLIILVVAGFAGDREASLRSVYITGWPATLRILAFSALVIAPLMWVHTLNHQWAMGAPPVLLWALMIFDSLVVGLLAVGWGTAIEHGYRPLGDDDRSDSVSQTGIIVPT